MAILDLFSKRQKRERGEVPDVYQYTVFPDGLRTQINYLFEDIFGNYDQLIHSTYRYAAFEEVVKKLKREHGVPSLLKIGGDYNLVQELYGFVLSEQDVEKVLDAVELVFEHGSDSIPHEEFTNAVDELNARFLEHGAGFQYESGLVVKIDSEFTHVGIVKPALALLRAKEYEGANEEFLTAHKHYRSGDYKECLNEALKAFESVMKVICGKLGYGFDERNTAQKLLKICFDNRLIPDFWQSHFTALRSTLESGTPTARNKLGGHGQGADKKRVPKHLAAYCINATASAILLLAQAADEI